MTLYERFRFRLRMIWLGLTLRPIAGGEETPEEKAAREKTEADKAAADKAAAEAAAEQTPPWGSDEEFNPERAWTKLQAVGADKQKLQERLDKLEADQKKREDAEKTEQQKLEERASSAEQKASSATTEAARLRVALKKGLTETQAKRLVGETDDDLEKDADDLLASFKSDEDEDDDDAGQAPRRPRERLRPGAAPSANAEKNDPASLAEAVPRSW